MPPRDAQAEVKGFVKAVGWGEVEKIRGATKEDWVLVAQPQRYITAAHYLLDMFLSIASNNVCGTYIQRVIAEARHWMLEPTSPLLQLTLYHALLFSTKAGKRDAC